LCYLSRHEDFSYVRNFYMNDWRELPPLNALKAFAAFAETGGVAKAGAALGVSHAAISQQIRQLESQMGLALVSRESRELVLTAQGKSLADTALAAFGKIAEVSSVLTGADAGRPLQITTTPSFAVGWLMPRLADFRSRHPGVDLVIDPTPELRKLGPEGADIAFRYGNGDWPGLQAQLLVRSTIVVVAAPDLISPKQVHDVSDLAELPWLQELGTSETTAFLEKYGVERGGRFGLTSLPGNLMLDAARAGQGVAVIARAFVEADVAAGRLHVLVEDDEREGYFLVAPSGVLRPKAKAFAQWALRQSREKLVV
jgi:LysR family transcriptional regulator, glycine cleavage system transcriptional activator